MHDFGDYMSVHFVDDLIKDTLENRQTDKEADKDKNITHLELGSMKLHRPLPARADTDPVARGPPPPGVQDSGGSRA